MQHMCKICALYFQFIFTLSSPQKNVFNIKPQQSYAEEQDKDIV